MATKKEKEWAVRVYRRSARGNDDRSVGVSGGGTSVGGWTRLVAKSDKGKCVAVRAVARRGFIALPKIRSRICLSKSGETKRDDDADGITEIVPVQRRGDAILVRGRGRSRTLFLRFKSEQECLDFSDHLVALNRPPPSDSIEGHAMTHSTGAPIPMDHDAAFRRNEEGALVAAAATTEQAEEDAGASEADLDVEEIAAYLARLLCDPEFDSLVRGVEACVASRPDLRAMLEAKASAGGGGGGPGMNCDNDNVILNAATIPH
jgi:hypothetical protein